MTGKRLLGEENFAGESGVDDVLQSVVFRGNLRDDFFEVGTVAEAHFTSDTVAQDLGCESTGEEGGLLEVDFAPAVEAIEGFAIGGDAGGIDFGGVLFISVGGAEEADGVEAFESEAGGIDFIVAAGAGGGVGVLGELIADGDGAADVGLDGRDVFGRGRNVAAEDAFIDPDPAEDG